MLEQDIERNDSSLKTAVFGLLPDADADVVDDAESSEMSSAAAVPADRMDRKDPLGARSWRTNRANMDRKD